MIDVDARRQTQRRPDLFVSYRRADKDFVEKFVTALEEQGPEVWWDSDIEAGDDWRNAIVAHLADSKYLVIVFSDACNSSKQLIKELAVADHLDKEVIPLKIDGADPKGPYLYELAWRNWISAHPDPIGNLDAAAARIIERLEEAGWTRPAPGAGTSDHSPPRATPATPEHDPAQTPVDTSFRPAPPIAFAASATLPPPTLPPPTPPDSLPASGTLPPPRVTGGSPSSGSLPPPDTALAPPTAVSPVAHISLPGESRAGVRDVFPFRWTDFILPVLFGLVGLVPTEQDESVANLIGTALLFFAMALAVIGMILFPIRYYRRRASPYRVAKNLLISNITFAVLASVGGVLAASSMLEDGETASEVRTDLAVGFPIFAVLIAAISFVLFLLLSKSRARRELRAHIETV